MFLLGMYLFMHIVNENTCGKKKEYFFSFSSSDERLRESDSFVPNSNDRLYASKTR